ncbi:hypothetical protein Chor_005336, partial [Crotalus horridus]
MNALHFGAMFFCFISLLCLLAALNSDYWIEDSDIHLGLWNACKDIECVIIDVEPIPGFCVMIAMSIFSGTFGSTNQYGWSFGLGWASFPLYLLTDLLASDRPETFGTMGALHTGATLLSFFSFLFLIYAFNSDYWMEDSDIHLGLGNLCKGTQCKSEDMKSAPAHLYAILIFMSLGMIAGVVSLVGFCTLNGQHTSDNNFISWIACIGSFIVASVHAINISMILGIIAGVVSLVGFCILIGQWRPDNNLKSHIAYIGSIVAGFCVMIAIIIFHNHAGRTDRFGQAYGFAGISFLFYLLS